MALSYTDIQRKIAALKSEAARREQQEVGEVVERIRVAIAQYGITAAELGLVGTTAAAPARGRSGAGVVYRDAQGRTWAGRGKRPQWLRDALAGGHSLDEFRVAA